MQNAFLLFDSDVSVSHAGQDPVDPGYETDSERSSETKKQSTSSSYSYTSSVLPFGQHVSLSSIGGPAYLTAQNLIQHVAFSLSDKVFAYSPDTFDLDLSLRTWRMQGETNAYGHETGFSSLETRSGAGNIALGYIFSSDFDLSKRSIPQTVVASSATLQHLRPALDQLSLLYSVANPVVAHIAAVDYAAASTTGLVTDYITAMGEADDLGLALVASTSTFEAQHMSLLATLLAKDLPSLHIYDGINVGRETTKVADVLGQTRLFQAYNAIADKLPTPSRRLSQEGRLLKLLDAFNEELNTDYKPFEYYGHAEPEAVLVVFGSVEGSIAAQLVFALSNNGVKVGAINVRIYRPFLEEEFVEALPGTVKSVSVLGQVKDSAAVNDEFEHSLLYRDVLAALSLSGKFKIAPSVVDVKYAREEVWTPSKLLFVFQHLKEGLTPNNRQAMIAPDRPQFDLLGQAVKRYTFWGTDASTTANAAAIVGQLLSNGPSENVQVRSAYDNLVQGGAVRTDLRTSEKSIEAPYSVTNSNIAFIGEEKLLGKLDLVASLQSGGQLIVQLPGAKGQDQEKIEKRLAASFKHGVATKQAQVFILDPTASSLVSEKSELETVLIQLAFLQFAWNEEASAKIPKLAAINGDVELLQALTQDLGDALWRLEIPESWSSEASEDRPVDIVSNSFVKFDKGEQEAPGYLRSWISAAQGLACKEVMDTRASLRPDAGVKTAIVRVKERRRLTPITYNRNVFHIEFDLGESGVKYAIGEALGIHAENDALQVQDFIDWYGLDADDIVELPSREDSETLESKTVYQSLMQTLDIFGRPPKKFYEQLAEFATDEDEARNLLALGSGSTAEAAQEFKRRSEVDTVTYADILLEFPSAHPSFHDLARIITPIKRREYSIASSQKVTPNSVSLLIVTVDWVDPRGRTRFGQSTRYLNSLSVGSAITVSIKHSVMKLPESPTAPLIMAGLGTGLAPFRAFVQERAWQQQQGQEIGPILLYMGSRHQREEYLFGEEWEAYRDAGIITLLGRAFSRDQPQKIYIQDRMRQSLKEIRDAYLDKKGSFYLCGPTWPVPDVTEVLEEAIASAARLSSDKVDPRKEIEKLKDAERYVLEVY